MGVGWPEGDSSARSREPPNKPVPKEKKQLPKIIPANPCLFISVSIRVYYKYNLKNWNMQGKNITTPIFRVVKKVFLLDHARKVYETTGKPRWYNNTYGVNTDKPKRFFHPRIPPIFTDFYLLFLTP